MGGTASLLLSGHLPAQGWQWVLKVVGWSKMGTNMHSL